MGWGCENWCEDGCRVQVGGMSGWGVRGCCGSDFHQCVSVGDSFVCLQAKSLLRFKIFGALPKGSAVTAFAVGAEWRLSVLPVRAVVISVYARAIRAFDD